MELKEGESVLKKGAVLASGMLFPSVLYLTSQRLVLENYVFGIFKRTIEIPLTDIKDVEEIEEVWPSLKNILTMIMGKYGSKGSFKTEYMQHGKPATISFFLNRYDDFGEEWVAQIQKAANLPAKKEAGQGG